MQKIEAVLQLPDGYLTSYEGKNNSDRKSYVALGWDMVSNVFGSVKWIGCSEEVCLIVFIFGRSLSVDKRYFGLGVIGVKLILFSVKV